MRLYLVNNLHMEDAILTENAFKQLLKMQQDDPFWSYRCLECPTEDDIANAMYWDETEEAFLSGGCA